MILRTILEIVGLVGDSGIREDTRVHLSCFFGLSIEPLQRLIQ